MSRTNLGVVLILVGLVLPIVSLVTLPSGTLQAVLIAAGIVGVLVGLFLVFGEEVAEPETSDSAPAVESIPAAGSAVPTGAEPRDDLTKIEGIGPKLQEALYGAGFLSFHALADSNPEKITEAVKATGFKAPFNAASWPQQAAMAAKGDWDGLEALQKQLTGGRA